MAYYVGDIPSEDIVIEPARDGEPIDLTPFIEDDTEVTVRDFAGALVDADFFVTFDSDGDIPLVILEWPGTTVFEAAGLFTLGVTLVGPAARERLLPVYMVAQEEDGWHTVDSARMEWPDAPADDARAFQILELAKQQCLEYAGALEEGQRPPVNYRHGQLMQARNLLNAGMVDPQDGSVGSESFVLRPFPLDWTVKQMLRPHSAIPVVG